MAGAGSQQTWKTQARAGPSIGSVPILGPVLKCSLEKGMGYSFHPQSYFQMTIFDIKKIGENDLRWFT